MNREKRHIEKLREQGEETGKRGGDMH